MKKYRRFEIDKDHLCSINVVETRLMVKDPDNITNEELVEIIQGKRQMTSMSSKDHPAFDELREMLGKKKYIRIERGWWNGDRVLKPFRLNGYLFKKDEQFSCGSAMGIHLDVALKYHPARFKK